MAQGLRNVNWAGRGRPVLGQFPTWGIVTSVTSGVPQGSILGPALFLLYVNNFRDSILNREVAMFADDTKVYKVVMSEDDGAALQQDLDNLSS